MSSKDRHVWLERFTTATATAKNVQTLILTRFFAGLFSASPVSIIPACFANIFDDYYRQVAITAFAMAVFAGPSLSPIVGGFIRIHNELGWRWTMYIPAIMGWAGTILLPCFQNETCRPVVLAQKAKALRRRHSHWAFHTEHEEISLNWRDLVFQYLFRPAHILFTELIVFLVTLYMSFVYG
jgi:DHA1 family multidrug resistance protein-like MFS transporter